MVCTKVEPAPEMLPDAHSTLEALEAASVVEVLEPAESVELSSEPQAPASSARARSADTPARLRNIVEVEVTERTVRGPGSATAATTRTEGELLANDRDAPRCSPSRSTALMR
jgi:hypothetical protein